jgi:hypothetical protein
MRDYLVSFYIKNASGYKVRCVSHPFTTEEEADDFAMHLEEQFWAYDVMSYYV